MGTDCCQWCSDVAGKYEMKDQPQGIFRRHDNCDCTVIYDGQVLRGQAGDNGKRSKKWVEVPKDAGAAAPTRLTQEQAKQLNDSKVKINKTSIDNNAESAIIKSRNNEDYLLITPKQEGPTTQSGTSLFSEKAIQKLYAFEKRINSDKYETALIISSDGKSFTHTSHLENEIKFTKEQMDSMKGRVLSHNHVNGSTFSVEDIAMLFENELEEIRSCNKDGSFVMRLPGQYDKKINLDYIKTVIKEYEKEATDIFRIKFLNGEISFQEYDVSVQQYSVETFAKNHKCDYYFERRI